MAAWFGVLLLGLVSILLVLFLVLMVEALAAALPGRAVVRTRAPGVRCAVLIPAHNEEAVLGATLTAVASQLQPGDRVLVVADNCTDGTAALARAAGVNVVERSDAIRRGKGYALDFGMRALEDDAPDVVVLLDADCHVQPGAIDLLVGMAQETGRPVQAAYVLELPPAPRPLDRLSAFAFLFKNLVRPLGLYRLGLPCLLTGSGMAFPWQALRDAPLASGNIVEDMQLGLDLALAGRAPLFCAGARVTGILPAQRPTAVRQRTRWEHGHLRTLLTQVPRLLRVAMAGARLGLLGLALELSVPPLSMLVLLYLATWALWFLAPALLTGILLGACALAAVITLLVSWVCFARDCLPFTHLLATPVYVLAKVPIYVAFLVKPERAWVRTARNECEKS